MALTVRLRPGQRMTLDGPARIELAGVELLEGGRTRALLRVEAPRTTVVRWEKNDGTHDAEEMSDERTS